MTTPRRTAVVHSICIASLFAAGTMASAAGQTKSTDVQQTYERQRAACLAGNTNQDRDVCLREAAAARQEALKGNLNDGSANYQQNQLERCKVMPSEDQATCRERILSGTTIGTPAQGGVLRELTTVEPAAPAKPAAPQPAAQPRSN